VIDDERFQRSERAHFRSTGFEVLLARVDRDGVDILTGPAALAWELLAEPKTTAALATELAECYSISMPTVDPDVRTLLEDLRARGWISEDAGSD